MHVSICHTHTHAPRTYTHTHTHTHKVLAPPAHPPVPPWCRQRAFFTGLATMLPNTNNVDVRRCMQSEKCGAKKVLNVSIPLSITYQPSTSLHEVSEGYVTK